MAFVPARPWWKFWPVIRWRHWRVVRKETICTGCLREYPIRRESIVTGFVIDSEGRKWLTKEPGNLVIDDQVRGGKTVVID